MVDRCIDFSSDTENHVIEQFWILGNRTHMDTLVTVARLQWLQSTLPWSQHWPLATCSTSHMKRPSPWLMRPTVTSPRLARLIEIYLCSREMDTCTIRVLTCPIHMLTCLTSQQRHLPHLCSEIWSRHIQLQVENIEVLCNIWSYVKSTFQTALILYVLIWNVKKQMTFGVTIWQEVNVVKELCDVT